MKKRTARLSLVWALTSAGLGATPAEAATRSFVTLRDDGTLIDPKSPSGTTRRLMKLYDAAGAPRAEVLSVWTSFTMAKSSIATLYLPVGNDTTGIGLEETLGGDGTMASEFPPVRSILLHNDFTKLEARAKVQGAEPENFARYLFLLELSHNWGPALRVRGADGKTNPLIGFTFHWSFWMDAGGSPAGGNVWKDNGDGTFTAGAQRASAIKYSMLDLYAMGLARANEVKPFGVLENAVPPADARDPFTRGAVTAVTFPWFSSTPITVSATRRTVTIDEVIAETGTRKPERSSDKLSLGIVLAVGAESTDEEVERLEEQFEPIAASLAPAFADATSGRGRLEVATVRELVSPEPPSEPPGPPPPVATASPPASSAPPPTASSGCATSGTGSVTPPTSLSAVLVAAALATLGRRQRVARRSRRPAATA